ncbi:PREDICTED: uncharacterized protein K02A2.6-like, partial [Vollenhovia emeryi]|uniref:uncharacterized protein K02A2.6-like n=1 Tax=Vollenhovia emeryi TaxID=411798 RepID=UPI0005F4FC64
MSTAEKLIEMLIKQQEAAEKRHAVEMALLREALATRNEQVAPAAAINAADQKEKNLAELMVPFAYDPENLLTFEAWYKRYETIFSTDVADWTPAAKIRLLLTKFSQSDYQKFADSILPRTPAELTLEEATKALKTLFGYRETKFAMRHKCFNLKKDDSESFINYSTRINKQGEKFDVTNCSADDFKVLLFISGLRSPTDSQILEKLLAKVDAQHKQLEAAADDAARNAIQKLTLQDLVNEAERLLSLKQDKSTVGEPSTLAQIHSVQKSSGGKQQQHQKKPLLPKCHFCGENHWHNDCPHRLKQCDTCKVKGHKAGFCTSASEFWQQQAKRHAARATESAHQVKQVTNGAKSKRKFVTPKVNGTGVRLQVDSASDITVIPTNAWIRMGRPALTPCKSSPKSASGDSIPLKGSFKCRMTLNNVEGTGTCHVSDDLTLLGIDWIDILGLWDVPLRAVCNQITRGHAENGLATEAQSKFPALFSEGLGLCTKIKVPLTLKENATPVFRKARAVPFAAQKLVEEEIIRQQQLGILTPVSYSDFAAPVVVVKKKNGGIRICGDYSTGLNDALEPNKFPLPTNDQIFAQMSGKKVFSKADFSEAFLQLELDDDAKKLLTINTHVGLFQVNRMQPGVKTAPGAFQELMAKMLSGLDGVFAFIDDVIIAAADEEKHKELLFKVLQRIEDHGFKLRIDKCEFGKKELTFCGHVVSSEGIRPNPQKIAGIKEIPRPEDLTQLRSFLGAVNYYGKFVGRMRDLRAPLDELMKKDVKFNWTPQREEAFTKLKEVMASDLVLTHYDPNKKIVVASDSSSYGKGGAVLHEFSDGSLHPIIHFSCSLSSAEKNYSQIEREACAADFVLKRARPYIYGRKFELHIDHKPLLAIFGSKKGIP